MKYQKEIERKMQDHERRVKYATWSIDDANRQINARLLAEQEERRQDAIKGWTEGSTR